MADFLDLLNTYWMMAGLKTFAYILYWPWGDETASIESISEEYEYGR